MATRARSSGSHPASLQSALLVAGILAACGPSAPGGGAATPTPPGEPARAWISTEADAAAREAFAAGRTVDLMVVLADGAVQETGSSRQARIGAEVEDEASLAARAARYERAKQRLAADMGEAATPLRDYSHLPMTFTRVRDAAALRALLARPDVASVHENRVRQAYLASSLPFIRQPTVAASGRTGAGTTVAVLDTGTDYTRAAFGSCAAPGVPSSCKVVYAADFTTTNDGQLDDPTSMHGTNVAGIVLGVAPDARIAALDVFQGTGAYDSDIIAAINWCVANRATYNIVAINMSLGGGQYFAPVDSTVTVERPMWTAINNARLAGIVTVAASGNDGWTSSMGTPAAIDQAVSVGAVYDGNIGGLGYSTCTDATTAADKVTCFSNSASFLTVLAPGAQITAAAITMYGTSQATPHAAGAVAVLKSAFPADAPTDTIRRLTTGVSVTDARNGIARPRIDLVLATAEAGPAITGASPRGGPPAGGTVVTLTGSGFASGATVTVGGAPATGVTVSSASSLTLTTPAGTAGAQDVVVTNPDDRTGTLAGGFTYRDPPTVTGIAPASGTAAGGTTVTVSGTGFVAGAAVTLGTAAASVTGVTDTTITAVTGRGAAGTVPVTVTNPEGQSATLDAAFTYEPLPPAPVVASIAPASGSTAGGTAVTITGSNFQAGARVTIGVAATVTSLTSTAITAVTAARTAGTVGVTVTNPDGQSGTLASAFTYAAPPTFTSLTPTSGSTAGGTVVTISGSGFVTGMRVTFSGVAATVTSTTATSLRVTTPAAGSPGPVTVTVTNPPGLSASRVNAYNYVLPAPTGLVAVGGSGQITLGWAAVAGATGYEVLRATTANGTYAVIGTTTTPGFVNTGLAAGATWSYRVRATSGTTVGTTSATVTASTVPGAPTNVKATAGTRRITVSWTAAPAATSYVILRSATSGGPYTQVGTATGTSFANTGLTTGSTWYYVVQARNAAGTGPSSAQVSATSR